MADELSRDWPHDQPTDDDPLAGFDTFYAEYPRHEARKDAEKAWKQIKAGLDPALRERIMANVRTRTWPREKRFVPLPASFLRGARYDDDPVTADAVPVTPANRWMPSKAKGGRIPDGHQWCEHDPMCADDRAHIQTLIAEREGAA